MEKINKKEIIYYLLAVLLGAFFIFSAYTKTDPIESFEYILKSQLPMGAFTAAWASRFIIGLEAALGVLLVFNFFGKSKWVISFSFFLVLGLTAHLVLLYFRVGNDVSCGCMGDLIPMKPLPSIAKNIILLALLALLWKNVPYKNHSWIQWTSLGILVVIIVLPFLIFPYQKQTLALEKMYNGVMDDRPTQDLRKGKHLLAFMSLTCSHCMDAATELSKMKKSDTALPIYIVFAKASTDSVQKNLFDNFKEVTHFANIPYSFLNRDLFLEYSGGYVPAIFWIEDGQLLRKVSAHSLNQKEFESWIKN
ncbi:MAG TPA: hypothetical protein PKX92_08830 [Edaphocola sp.]|nr:hypothetical protein [Edaphocola sp.]